MSTQAAAFGTPHRHPSADRLSLAYRVYGERNILSPATVARMQWEKPDVAAVTIANREPQSVRRSITCWRAFPSASC